MSFDKPTRNALAKMVAACRERLAADISDQLQSAFGLYPDGTRLDVARTEADKLATTELRALLDYFITSDASGASNSRNAYQRLVREIGFTTLNRLAALRLCEERGLVIECVRRGMDSDGFRLFDRVANGALGTRYATYRAFIEGMYDELALELTALFDRHHPHSHVFPGEAVLGEVLALLNDPELAKREIWQQDETIGWIYQYYNDPSERKKMRDESQAPRNSRELAVRNQFFTPRYVVEFLTDNTLGRIWFEMRGGETVLAEVCRYLVKPTSPPTQLLKGDGSRKKKDPRDLKILDPACGSGHFLLYAFDLLLQIYEEAWADVDLPLSVETGTLLRDDYPDLESLRRAVPALILRHNLHGIDIDARAAQIAALALWLRAQRAYMELRLSPDERPVIQKTNIVTAEPMPGDPMLLEDFLATVEVPFIQKLVREVFDKMTLTGEAGSLLKIEEEIRDSIAAAKQAWLKRPKTEQMSLWQDEKQPRAEQLALFEGITDESFWEQAEQRVLVSLRNYARHAENGKGTRQRLFVEDTERGFAFIDISQNRFDVILMNPPFGEAPLSIIDDLDQTTSSWNKNILCAFFIRTLQMLNDSGLVGVIFDRTAAIKTTYEDFRRDVILQKGRLQALVDLGWGVLDANVEVSATILAKTDTLSPKVFVDLVNVDSKESALSDSIESYNRGNLNLYTKYLEPEYFNRFPNAVVSTQFPRFLIAAFGKFASIRIQGFQAIEGHSFKSDRHFRLRWEINQKEKIDFSKEDWSLCFNGGEFYPIYKPSWDVAYYGNDGDLILGQTSVTLRSVDKHGKFSVGYGKRGEFIDAQILPRGYVFTVEGEGAPVKNMQDASLFAALLNSQVFQIGINSYCGQHKYPGYVNKFPMPSFSDIEKADIQAYIKEIYDMKIRWFTGDETDLVFVCPHLLANMRQSLKMAIQIKVAEYSQDITRLSQLWQQINDLIISKYELDDLEKKALNDYISRMPNDRPWEILANNSESAALLISDIVSYNVGIIFGRWDINNIEEKSTTSIDLPEGELPTWPIGMLKTSKGLPISLGDSLATYPIQIAWDGILVDDPGLDGNTLHLSDIVRCVRDVLEVLWKDNHAEIEAEACEILGVKDLRDYFRKPGGFFADHLKRYSKSRRQAPIYWPLSTPSGSYTLWIYYHRLSDEILFTAVNRYVDPKIEQVERRVNSLQMELGKLSGKSATEARDQLDEVRDFLAELRQFREELLRIANLPYKPNLNDGVILNAAPFHRLFRLNKWAKDTESAWKKLEAGEYNWAHIAYVLYPDKVREACKTDKSIAIAHGLESLYEGKETVKMRKKKSKKNDEEQDEMEMD